MHEGTATQEPLEPAGFGGWLVLVGIGLVLAPLRLTAFIFQTHLPIFQDGTWELLTTPGSDAYDAAWAPLLTFELVGNAALLVAAFVLLVFFLRRSRQFPGLYIAVSFASFIFILLDAWLVALVLPDVPMFDAETGRELGRSVAGIVIWVPYMFSSKRVRNTFVE